MRNLLFMTFVTMGLLFSSCSAFNLIQPSHAEKEEVPSLKITDHFDCEFQFVGDEDQLLYTHSDSICVEREPSENCFLGDNCTHSSLIANHKVLYGEDEVGYFVNFSYDHFLDSTKNRAMLYVCDQSILSVSSEAIKKDFYKDECLSPQLGTYDVPKQQLESVQIPGFMNQLFQGYFKLDSGEIFQVFCEFKKTEVGMGCG